MDIRLLTLPQVNWQEYINFGSKVLGYSPSKVLDDKRINLNSPKALLVSFNSVYRCKDSIFELKPTVLRLLNLQFMMNCTIEELNSLRNFYVGNFTILTQTPEVFCICNLSLLDCQQLIAYGHKDFEVRKCINMIYLALQTAELDIIMSEYTKIQLEDGTFKFDKRK